MSFYLSFTYSSTSLSIQKIDLYLHYLISTLLAHHTLSHAVCIPTYLPTYLVTNTPLPPQPSEQLDLSRIDSCLIVTSNVNLFTFTKVSSSLQFSHLHPSQHILTHLFTLYFYPIHPLITSHPTDTIHPSIKSVPSSQLSLLSYIFMQIPIHP